MKFFVFLALFFGPAQAYRGQGTAYSGPHNMDDTGVNMCEFKANTIPEKWQRNYAALSQNEWESNGMYDVCGRCIRACGTEKDAEGRCVVAMVVDQCPDWACDPGNVDFSTVALEAATGYDWDRKSIEWEFVECDTEMKNGDIEAANSATNGALAELETIAMDAKDVLDSLTQRI